MGPLRTLAIVSGFLAAAVTLTAQSSAPLPFRLVDVTKSAGITFTHQNGASFHKVLKRSSFSIR